MKSFTNFLIFLIYLAIAARGSPLQEIDARADACTTKSMLATIATINSGVGMPLAFCNWFLTDGRTRSPINGLSVQSLQSACVCLGGSRPAKEAVASTTMKPGVIATSCAVANVHLLKARFVDYKTFCTFYLAAPRDSSPLPALGPKGLWNACECALGHVSTPTSKTALSTLSTTTSKPTSGSLSTTSTLPVLSTITSIIEAQTYQSFCSAFLSYKIPSATVTTTETVNTTATATSASLTTQFTTLVTDTTSTSVETDISMSTTSITETNTVTATETVTFGATAVVDKRFAVEVQVPQSLSSYNSVLLSSACQIVVPRPTNTVTTSATALVTTTVTKVKTSASTVIGITTATSTIIETSTVETLEATTIVMSATSTFTTTITTSTGLVGNMVNGDAYWGFSDSPSVGSVLQFSSSDIFTDVFIFTSGQDEDASGYILHTASGLCLTLTAATTDSTTDIYNGGTLQLQTCGTTATPPQDQSFGYQFEGCIGAGSNHDYFFVDGITSTATDSTLSDTGGYCISIS